MTTAANPPPGAHAVGDDSDPFLASPQDAHRQRYAAFDNSDFSLYAGSSPAQAKKALQAHLAETTRRLQETSHLGNALVQQRKELEERLQEVDQQEKESEIGPELRERLSELEKEFNEVGRETARAFLPKSRVPSGETDTPAGASVFTSEAQHSPSKISVPSRKQRNQQPSRMNDIALATEISTSLLAQLKDLQAVLLEKDEALKAADLDRSQLEIEVEGLSQRMRTLDESESRLKDVNWNLETQVREFEQQAKANADREHRLNHNINLAKTEKAALEREFEELKQMYAKLNDDQSHRTKQHETELSGLRRNVSMGETERGALQRKMEELATQNQELAKAVAYRMRSDEQGSPEDTSPEENADEGHTITPEHSPPPSPTKATPRHGQLESETLKHSLNHAHRMIQQLKNNIHREKTEKMELKRMLQESRDELETSRNAVNAPSSASKRRKHDKDVFKKPARPDRLGALRMGSQEIVMDDEEWEEQDEVPPTPSRRPKQAEAVPGAFSSGFTSAAETSITEGFETANETSDAAFETANERDETGTETDAFQTGAETLDGNSSDDLTETEAGPSAGTIRRRPNSFTMSGHQDSYESTASTSGDEWDNKEYSSPGQQQHSRYRLKTRQGYRRTTPRGSVGAPPDTPPTVKESPSSYMSHGSNRSTPIQGKSLLAELGGFSGGESEDGSAAEGTPGRSSVISPESSPEVGRKINLGKSPLHSFVIPRNITMVDSGVMTEPWEPAVEPPNVERSFIWTQNTEPRNVQPPTLHISSVAAQDTTPQSAPIPSLVLTAPIGQQTEPRSVPPPSLALASFPFQTTEPRDVPRPSLGRSILSSQNTVPQAVLPPSLQMGTVSGHGTEPQAVPRPTLERSVLSSQNTVPQALQRPALQIGTVSGHGTEPHSPPPRAFNLSTVSAHHTVPQSPARQAFSMSTVSGHDTEPQSPVRQAFSMSTVSGHDTVPHSPPRPSYTMSSHWAQGTEPSQPAGDRHVPVSLDVSNITGQATEPVESSTPNALAAAPLMAAGLTSQVTEPSETTDREVQPQEKPQQAPLGLASPSSQFTAPSEPPKLPPLSLNVSGVSSQSTAPVELPQPKAHQLSSVFAQNTAPVEAPTPARPQLSTLSSQYTAPVEGPAPARLQLSTMLSTQNTAPVETPLPARPQLSTLSSQNTAPVEAPAPARPQLSALSSQTTVPVQLARPSPPQISGLFTQVTQPVESAKPSLPQFAPVSFLATAPISSVLPAAPQLSALSHQHVLPVEAQRPSPPGLSTLNVQRTDPIEPVVRPQPIHSFSDVTTLHNAEPESPTLPHFLPVPSRPATATRVVPPVFGMSNIASHETAPQVPSRPVTAHRAVPPNEQSLNGEHLTQPKQQKISMADGGTQTMVSSEQIDRLLLARNPRHFGTLANADVEKPPSTPTSPSKRGSSEQNRLPRRPSSSSSVRSRGALAPPLPADHKQVIAAAALKSPPSSSPQPPMGPPVLPASAYKKRPETPTIKTTPAPTSPKAAGATSRAKSRSQPRSGAVSPITHRSSISSFTSELDHRFNMGGMTSLSQTGLDPTKVDPRMIQAITQTMMGEFMWKYTRKAGREGISQTRHRRYFWVHPFTRTVYWSKEGPSRGAQQVKAKSLSIEAVHTVADNNPLPPGLHQHSIVITTPGRTIQFTAPTSQRHETWVNALLYLLQRSDEDPDEAKSETDEIHDEFNPTMRSASRQTGRSRASHATYSSRRTASPSHSQYPTLRPRTLTPNRPNSRDPVQGTASQRLSSMFRSSSSNIRGSFVGRFNKPNAQEATITDEEPSAANERLGHDLIEPLARPEGFEMEDVRACCNGKHHLHKLPHHHHHHNNNTNNNKSRHSSFIGSINSRSQSRTESHKASEPNDQSRNHLEVANNGA